MFIVVKDIDELMKGSTAKQEMERPKVKYIIKFKYFTEQSSNRRKSRNGTSVAVFAESSNKYWKYLPNLIAEAYSFCNPIDSYNKIFGEKLALQRAIEWYQLDKETSRAIWQEYFKMRPEAKGGNKCKNN